MERIILDLCGGTGAWSKPYSDAGYDVRLVTLPEHDVLTYEPPERVYGILAAPPCESFSVAANHRKRTPEDRALGMPLVEACMRIIWRCEASHHLAFWALENPTGHLRKFLGLPVLTFQHWQYGDDAIKPTDIWGYFRLPSKLVHNKPPEVRRWREGHYHSIVKSPGIRAITPAGFAQQFYSYNK